MQLTSPFDETVVVEGQMAPFEDIVPCQRIKGHDLVSPDVGTASIDTMSSSSPNSLQHDSIVEGSRCFPSAEMPLDHQENDNRTANVKIRPECFLRHQTTPPLTTNRPCEYNAIEDDQSRGETNTSCNCPDQEPAISSNSTNPKKRKLLEEEKEDSADKISKTDCDVALMEKYRRHLLLRRLIIDNLAQGKNVPLYYLYGDLLLIPKYNWGGVGIGGGGVGGPQRRSSLNDPSLITPIDDSVSSLDSSSRHYHPRSKTPSLVQVCPDSQMLAKGGFSPEYFDQVMAPVMSDLNRFGVCVVDTFLGEERANQILDEVGSLHSRGVFHDGQVVSRNVQDQARGIIRGDKITWVTGSEPHCGKIGQLVSVVDTLIAKANKHVDGGELNKYNIKWRTRAMVACYPGQGTHYVKHVDNPDGDGRCITAIYYINKDWTRNDGGVLRIYPEGSNQVAEIEPKFDRMLFFWSDRRNPHEVLEAKETRFAITVWYLDQTEREEYLSRVSRNPSLT